MNKKIIPLFFILGIISLCNIFYNPNSTTTIESNTYLTPANTSFDDDNFYKCITDNLGVSEDTNVTDEQLESITYLNCAYKEIKSSKGLEKLTGLISLKLDNNQLTNIDISKNTNLTSLQLSTNQLTNIDLTKNEALTELYLYNNQLRNIDVTKNTNLTSLQLYNNQLISIDISKNIILKSLTLNDNQLTSININENTALTELYLYNNKLTNINITNNINLSRLSIDEDVEVIGETNDIRIDYNPKYMFSNKILEFDLDKYEYTINISNSIDKLALGINFGDKAYHYSCPDNVLCGGLYMYYMLGYSTINGKTFDRLKIFDNLEALEEEQCHGEYPCDIYENNKLIAKIDENEMIYMYDNDELIGYTDDHNILYFVLSDLEVGTNILKLVRDEERIYTINIIRSDKELDNNPNEELNNILDDIVNNNIDNSPNTGNYLSIIVAVAAIILVGILYFIFYKKVKKRI